ncbi:DUF2842 domain-containing protein [Rhodobacter sp. Har01]|uniref:DUF2842 domain-containing protein n=1 Tax=Rhodobacter sp. Har01 TaxID=2883999 RepID=UPI001D07E1CA|nr:DUF2842 domain-containing protein [Rhodobacter sp. Har01]MCB6178856.1 DUF2842 domain-containing protein [Rhodobacter sp. Har01]
MALSYRTRKRLALLILVVGMPLYVVAAVTLVNWADARWGRLPIWAEVAVYLTLGLLWALPFRSVFRGVGQADPQAAREKAKGPGPSA